MTLICPGCQQTTALDREGRFVPHVARLEAHAYCSWAGRTAIDFTNRRTPALDELRRQWTSGGDPPIPRDA